ncbi:MAG: hypothetical protein K5739_12605 [Lachnospiraceae bacterium]|nr:hypothetical protein [Lachnospiraceae bacterium]
MTNFKNVGVAIGIMVGLIVSIFILKAINKDGKFKSKYDEMQEIVRGRAYKYGFWAIAIYELIMCVVADPSFDLPLSPFLIHFTAIIVGVMVQVTYSIWHDAYIALNTNTGRFTAVAIFISLFNLLIAGIAMARGAMMENGQLQDPFMNLIVGVMFVIIGIELLVKNNVDKAAKRED